MNFTSTTLLFTFHYFTIITNPSETQEHLLSPYNYNKNLTSNYHLNTICYSPLPHIFFCFSSLYSSQIPRKKQNNYHSPSLNIYIIFLVYNIFMSRNHFMICEFTKTLNIFKIFYFSKVIIIVL